MIHLINDFSDLEWTLKEKTSADELEANWAKFLEGSPDLLRSYLKENSNLPGPRGNLMLAERLSKLVSRTWKENLEYLIEALEQWRTSDNECLLFCYYSTLGHLMAHHSEERAHKMVNRITSTQFILTWGREGYIDIFFIPDT